MSNLPFDISPQGPYFSVIRSAIWNTPLDTSSWPKKVDWNPIIQNYSGQSILPLVSNVLNQLPEPYKLTDEQINQIFDETLSTTKGHCRIRDIYKGIFNLFVSKGLTPILLKGESLAVLYPNPLLRSCGDIDIYLEPSECDKAVSLLCDIGAINNGDHGQHYELMYQGIIIELHHELGEVDRFRGIKGMQEKTTKMILADILTEKLSMVYLKGTDIPCYLLPAQSEAIFLFLHLSKHLIGSGVGLRQFIDQSLLFNSIQSDFSTKIFQEQIKNLKYGKIWNMIATVMIEYLGLNQELCPVYKPLREIDKKYIVKYLVEVGDFSRLDVKQQSIHEAGVLSFIRTYLIKHRFVIRYYPKRFLISVKELICR